MQRQASVGMRQRLLLEARLLGGCALRYDGRPLPESAFRRRRTLTLLLFLLSIPSHRAPREQLLELLWPEKDPEESERGLRVVLADLRTGLGGSAAHSVVIGRGPFIGLRQDLELIVDADIFELAANRALSQPNLHLLQQAAALYTGPYLADQSNEQWARGRREYLRQLHEQVLSSLVGLEEDADPTSAERRLRQLLLADPTAEPTARRLMELLARQERHTEALQVVQVLAAALHDELGLTPAAETEALRRRLLSAEPTEVVAINLVHTERPQPRQRNLPAPLTSFIGREQEVAEIKSMLLQPQSACRVLMLTGPDGCGKTRLALEVANLMRPHFPGGIWLVELASLTDPRLVPQALATVLGVQEPAQGRSVTDQVIQALHKRQVLVLLDNCEHVISTAASLAMAIVHACPQVRLLATSRQALGIVGEVTWRVPSLAIPPATGSYAEAAFEPNELVRFGAVRLFIERARASRPGFTLTATNTAQVVQICRRLDGIPLAIELAAAQLRGLNVHDLVDRLDMRFRLLSIGNRAVLPRHRTLQAVMDWSYALLREPERLALQRLSVFAGGWTIDAAAAVCAVAGSELLQHVSQLVAKSLVTVEESGDQEQTTPIRYRMLETVRQYARDQLDAAGETTAAQQRHAAWYLALAEQIEPALAGAGQIEAHGRLEADHDNLRAAVQWSFAELERAEGAVRLVLALWRFWEICGHWSEAGRWLSQALALRDRVAPQRQSDMLGAAGTLAFDQGDLDRAAPLFAEVLALGRQRGDQPSSAFALHKLARIHQYRGEFDRAVTLYKESLALKRTLGDTRGMGATLNSLGVAATSREQYDEALRWFGESRNLWVGLRDTLNLAYSLNNIGTVLRRQGNLPAAISHFEESLELFRKLGEQWGIAAARHNLGLIARLQGDYARAAMLYRQSLLLWRDLGDKRGIAESLEEWAELAGGTGMPDRAARLFGAAAALRAAISAPLTPADRTVHTPLLGAIRATLGEEAFAHLWARGQGTTTEQAITMAVAEHSAAGRLSFLS